ncbi:hypothetical protein IPN41_03230 [Candidatus Falkowbacteria bacterium]|nr:MAG: hypothetical protein IPN41_03230 [Candidatus Falkowbacteria bacterium]
MAEQIVIKPEQSKAPTTEGTDLERVASPEVQANKAGSEATESAEKAVLPTNIGTQSVSSTTNPVEAQRLADIERILEEDLSEIYFKLPEADKVKFRVTGEQTAKEINSLLSSATVKLKKIIEVITGWLKLIPGVSKFFLEQEAKIKADRLLKLHNHD